MLYNQSLLDAWKFFYFPDQTWVRINLLRLSEVDFKKTPDRVTEAISNKVGCVMTCLANELGNGALRRREDHHSAGSMGHVEKWHQLSTSRVLTDHGRNEPVATQTAINYRSQGVPKTLFTSKDHENSLGATYDKLSAPNVDWMNLTWEHRRKCFFAFRIFVNELEGDWRKLGKTWPSLFAVRKCFLYSTKPCFRNQGGVTFCFFGTLVYL